MTTQEKKNISPTLQQFLRNPQITIICIKMKKGNLNSFHHILQNLQLKRQKMQFLTMKIKLTNQTKTTTIIKFINHKNSQILLMTRKNMFLKHLSQQIILIIKNKTITKNLMFHIIIRKINMNKFHPKHLAMKLNKYLK